MSFSDYNLLKLIINGAIKLCMNKKVFCIGTFIVDIINEPVEKALGANEGVRTSISVNPGGDRKSVV